MNIYFCGIGGVGIGPLAEIAKDAGHSVQGSDTKQSLTTHELEKLGIDVSTDQSGANLVASHARRPIDWFVYTSALPADHPELLKAKELGIVTAKRDELINYIVREKRLKLIAVAGTHGKTTTTAMLVWTLKQLGIPVSYSVGATMSFAPSGYLDPKANYFVYECDEFDRNFLHFEPYLSLVTSIDYDHPDTYPTKQSYADAFTQFLSQSRHTIMWQRDTALGVTMPTNSWSLRDDEAMTISLPGAHNRANATLVAKACEYLGLTQSEDATKALESFPGTSRRFERLADNLYSDYGHHPVEIKATLQMARELADHVTLVYQPHQNVRQHEIREQYTHDVFAGADTVYWLPTYLSREDPGLEVLTPEALTKNLSSDNIHIAELSDELWKQINRERDQHHLVLAMGAGSIDSWLRDNLTKH